VRVNERWGWFQVRTNEEYLEFSSGIPLDRVMDLRFSADGQFLAVGNPAKVSLCDPVDGAVLLPLPSWRMSTVVFHPRTHALLTANTPGLISFAAPIKARSMALPHPTVLNPLRRWRALDITPDGRWLAAFNGLSNAVVAFDATVTLPVAEFGPHAEAEEIAISPDGQWVATSSFEDRSVRVWDVARRSLVLAHTAGTRPKAAFSPDGEWLGFFGDSFALRKVGSWKVAPPPPFPRARTKVGAAAFSPDGRLLAVVGDLTQLHLFNLLSFQARGILRPSEGMRLRAIAFSADGTTLATVDAEG